MDIIKQLDCEIDSNNKEPIQKSNKRPKHGHIGAYEIKEEEEEECDLMDPDESHQKNNKKLKMDTVIAIESLDATIASCDTAIAELQNTKHALEVQRDIQQIESTDNEKEPRRKQTRKRLCGHNGCEKKVQNGGKCVAHGAVRALCKHKGCKNKVVKKGICVLHGAILKRCSHQGCTNQARQGGVCCKHGAILKRCTHEGCEKYAQHGGKCVAHGAVHKKCRHQGCTNQACSGGVCYRHGAVRKLCSQEGCERQAQCGGQCVKHGAMVKRCSHQGCTNQVQNRGKCVAHGAILKRCSHKGCTNQAQFMGLCVAHGGVWRCESAACAFFKNPEERGAAKYFAPESISGSIKKGDRVCFACLAALFPDKTKLKVRQEHMMLAEIQRRIGELEDYFVTWDCPVPGGCSMKRPDMLWRAPHFYFQIEIDEYGEIHEDSRERLLEIQNCSMEGLPAMVLRINPTGMLTKRQHTNGEYMYTATSKFGERMHMIETYIRENVLEAMVSNNGVLPQQLRVLLSEDNSTELLHVERLFFN